MGNNAIGFKGDADLPLIYLTPSGTYFSLRNKSCRVISMCQKPNDLQKEVFLQGNRHVEVLAPFHLTLKGTEIKGIFSSDLQVMLAGLGVP